MPYEWLLIEASKHKVLVYERPMGPKTKGLYSEGIVWINGYISTSIEKACILAEELGHHHTSSGNIIDQTQLINRKQERRARVWGYKKLFPLATVIDAHIAGIRNRHELADRLNVTEEFLNSALNWYREKYGLYIKVGEHTICLDPLGVLEMFE
jgi:hypothetical protein